MATGFKEFATVEAAQAFLDKIAEEAGYNKFYGAEDIAPHVQVLRAFDTVEELEDWWVAQQGDTPEPPVMPDYMRRPGLPHRNALSRRIQLAGHRDTFYNTIIVHQDADRTDPVDRDTRALVYVRGDGVVVEDQDEETGIFKRTCLCDLPSEPDKGAIEDQEYPEKQEFIPTYIEDPETGEQREATRTKKFNSPEVGEMGLDGKIRTAVSSVTRTDLGGRG